MILFSLLIIFSITTFILQYIEIYAVTVAAALMLLIFAVLKIIMDKTVVFYEERIKADFYKKLAYTDVMTEIYNRNAFDTDLYAVSDTDMLCFVVFDIDMLKTINDSRGHEAGDEIIRAAANIIKGCLSPLGKCYRIGGDEFAVICKGKSENELKTAFEEFDGRVDRYNLEHELKLSIAYGYAFRKSQTETPDELFERADKHMYQRKKKK